jgi:hypothetical protein
MPVKSIVHPADPRRRLCFGRKRPIAIGPRLHLKNYLMRSIPPPPISTSYVNPAAPALSEMYLNDQLGDCVPAWMCHNAGVFAGNAALPQLIFTGDQVTSLYSAIGGYVPGDPSTDNGCDEVTALNYWTQSGLLPGTATPHKITGYMAVNPTDPIEIKTALWLFENLMFGIELPDAWVTPFPSSSGFIWDVAGPPDPDNGHCPGGVGYDSIGVLTSTWGMIGTTTWAAVAEYCSQSANGSLYTVIAQDAISKASSKCPIGLDWSQLLADFESLSGTPPAGPMKTALKL